MALGVYCFNWTQSSRSLSGSYNEGAVVLPLERLIPTPITLSVLCEVSAMNTVCGYNVYRNYTVCMHMLYTLCVYKEYEVWTIQWTHTVHVQLKKTK